MARILVITPSYSPRLGGVEKHVWQTSRLLQKNGWRVSLVTQHFPDLAEREKKEGIALHRFSFPKLRFFGLLVIWWRLLGLWREVAQADVVHIHDVFIWYFPLRFLFWNKPVITTFHGWEGVYPVPRKNIFIRKIAVALSSKTVAVGKYLEKYYRFTANEVLYGAVETPRVLGKKEDLLLYVGRLNYDTGLPVLLQALQSGAWKGRMVFCGDGLLREQAEQLGEVQGFVDPRPFLKKAKVVFAGGYLSVLEAFAYQCAVIAAEKNPLKKDYFLLSPFSTWITLVRTPKEVARELAQMRGSSARQKAVVDSASRWARQQTWQSITDTYQKLYSEVAGFSSEEFEKVRRPIAERNR